MAGNRTSARSLDQFYTRSDVARDCVGWVREFLGETADQALWIEPSAGAGAFLDHFPALWPERRLALDLVPQRDDIVQGDFLTWVPPAADKIVVVGNPPFGKNASLAQRFVNHAAGFAAVVAFIVPRTFQKASLINRLDRQLHLAAEFDLPDNAFVFGGAPYHVPTVFQIWERRTEPRALLAGATTHPDFAFVPSAAADFAFQRVGARAGLVSREGLRKSPQSHYFIRAAIDPQQLLERLAAINWHPVKSRTAGNPSISKRELVSCYGLATL